MAASAYYNLVQEFYIGFYGRFADPAGLNYWAGVLDSVHGDMNASSPLIGGGTVLQSFATSAEASSFVFNDPATGLPYTQSELIDNIYDVLFGRAADAAGKAFYIDLLNGTNNSGSNPSLTQTTLVKIVQNVVDGATGTDATEIANKVEVATFATQVVDAADATYGADQILAARAVIAGVTEDHATVATGLGEANNFANNTAPAAAAGAATVDEDHSVSGTLAATDAQNQAMTFALVADSASHGTATVNADGSYTFTPNSNFNGTGTFQFTATDSYGLVSTPATVTVTVNPVDDAPALVSPAPATINVVAGSGAVSIDLHNYATDIDSTLTFTAPAVSSDAGSIVDNGNGTVSYTPNNGLGAGVVQSDTFTISASDGTSTVSTAVNINVTNNAPTAAADAFGTGASSVVNVANGQLETKVLSGLAYKLDVLANDNDGEAAVAQTMTITSVTQPALGGLVEIVDGGTRVQFTSTPGYVSAAGAPVTFTYTTSDGFGGTATSTASVVVETQLGGTPNADYLIGSTATETLSGGAGNDTIDGGSGTDQIDGGADNDRITERGSEANITGNTGVDTLVIPATNNGLTRVDLSSGADQSTGDTVTTTSFENLDASAISQNLSVSTVLGAGAAGDNAATTSILTGSGNDWVIIGNSTATPTVDTGLGNDTITAGAAGNITAGDGNDTITVNAANVIVSAGAGTDTVTASSSADSISGGDGNDTFNFAEANMASGDSVTGGAGTDILNMTDTAAVTDAELTNFLTVETIKLASGTAAQTVTLAAQAQEAGIVTVDGSASAFDVTVNASNASFTSGVTVLANSADNSVTGGSGNDTIVSNAAAQLDTTLTTDDSIAGGTGTDTVRLDNDSAADGTGNAVTMTVGAGLVSGVEQIVINDIASDNAAGDATVTFVAGYAQTSGLTVDGSALDAGEVLTVDTSANAASETVTILGGAANDVFTLSSIADSVSGGAGNDTFKFIEANLASSDSVTGGTGTDTLEMTDTAAVTDAELTNFLTVETIKLAAGTGAQTVTLAAQAQEAGIVTVNASASAQDVTVNASNAGFTSGVTVLATSADNSITGGSGNDTIVSNAAAQLDTTLTTDDSIAGGTGTDTVRLDNDSAADGTGNAVTMTVGAGLVSGIEQIVINDIATDNAAGDATVTFVAGYAQTTGLTVDGSALDAGEVLTVDTSANAASETVTILGGAADDVFTLSSIADSVSGGAGNDTFNYAEANLASSDSVTGGDGTDVLAMTNTAAVTDAELTNFLTVETIQLASGTAAQTVTLAAQAQEAGIVTVNASASAQDVTVDASNAGFTSGVTVLATSADNSITGGSGNDTIVSNAAAQLDTTLTTDDSIAGGTGTDTVRLDNDSSTDGTGNAVTMTVGAGLVSGVEQIVINDIASDNAAGDATVTFVAGYAQLTGLTVDGSALDAGEVLTVNTSANAASETVTILGGAADDVFTLSSIADSVDGGAGNDTFNIAVASLASSDSITGGAGTADTLALSTAADAGDALFTNVATVERLTLTSGAASYVLGAQAQEAGIATVVAAGTGDTIVTINAGAYTSAISISASLGATGDDTVFNIYGGSGNDTINLNNSYGTGNDFVQGGAGADTITLGDITSATSTDTVRINLSGDLASGTTVASADTYNAFQDGADLLEFVGGTLASGGGGQVVLSTTGDDLNTGSDVYKATTLAELATFNAGSVGTAYVIVLDDNAVFGANGFTGGAGAATAQGAIDAVVTYLTGNSIASTAVANTNVILGATVDTNNDATADGVALFQYQEGTLDAGIQAGELTLIGIFNGVDVDNLSIADFQ